MLGFQALGRAALGRTEATNTLAEHGTFAVAGQDALLSKVYVLGAGHAEYILDGQDVVLDYFRVLDGIQANLRRASPINSRGIGVAPIRARTRYLRASN